MKENLRPKKLVNIKIKVARIYISLLRDKLRNDME